MHLAWLTDVHLNFLSEMEVENFLATVRKSILTRCW